MDDCGAVVISPKGLKHLNKGKKMRINVLVGNVLIGKEKEIVESLIFHPETSK